MERINFNTLTDEELHELERKAWNNVLDISGFPAAEYKFFDTVRLLGMKCRHDNIPAELFKDDIRKAREIYRREREQLTYNLEAQKNYLEARLKARELVNLIYKTNDFEGKLRLALQCAELLINEDGLTARNMKGE